MAKPAGWASSLAEAKRNAIVNMVASSGTKYSVRPLTLDELAAEEGLPDELLRVAILDKIPGGVAAQQIDLLRKGNPEALEQSRQLSRDLVSLRDRIVLRAVQSPALKARDLPQLDPYDLHEIALVAQHRLIVDETGGLVDPFATFPAADQQ